MDFGMVDSVRCSFLASGDSLQSTAATSKIKQEKGEGAKQNLHLASGWH
jgi:hypothetical protein